MAPVAEGNIMVKSCCGRIMVALYRLLITVALAAPFAIPAAINKVDEIEDGPVGIMKYNIVYPALGASFFIVGGPVDFVIFLFENMCCKSLHKKRTRNKVLGRTIRDWYEQEVVKERKLAWVTREENKTQ